MVIELHCGEALNPKHLWMGRSPERSSEVTLSGLCQSKPIVVRFNHLSTGYGVGCDGIINFMNWKVVKQLESIREKSFVVESLYDNEMDLNFQITKTANKISESCGKIF